MKLYRTNFVFYFFDVGWISKILSVAVSTWFYSAVVYYIVLVWLVGTGSYQFLSFVQILFYALTNSTSCLLVIFPNAIFYFVYFMTYPIYALFFYGILHFAFVSFCLKSSADYFIYFFTLFPYCLVHLTCSHSWDLNLCFRNQ